MPAQTTKLTGIVPDPDFDLRALFNQFDTALLGRRMYEMTQRRGSQEVLPIETQ